MMDTKIILSATWVVVTLHLSLWRCLAYLQRRFGKKTDGRHEF